MQQSIDRYEQIKELTGNRNLVASAAARDIAAGMPPVDSIDWDARNKANDDLRFFLEHYFPNTFRCPWSKDHLRAIEKIQYCSDVGGKVCLAMPRSSGKTAILIRAVLWCILTGRKRFVVLIAANQDKADQLLRNIHEELLFNQLLHQDYPTACYPFQRLEGNNRKASGQLYEGKPTRIESSKDALTFATIDREDCVTSASLIWTYGLTTAIRGAQYVTTEGETIRPDFVLLDDPQTRESAASPGTTQKLIDTIKGDVNGLAGHDKTISCFAAVTVIYKDDLSDRLLLEPLWHGERTKLVYAFPTNEKLWDEYRELLAITKESATEHYKANQAAMDAGAIVAWPDAFDKSNEASAIQHAMNRFFEMGPDAFNAEYQNDPQFSAGDAIELLPPTKITERVNKLKRGVVPNDVQWITAFVDVQHSLLYWTVLAFEQDFTSYVIDYGAYPDQHRPYFTLKEAKNTLQKVFPTGGKEGQVWSGLESLADLLFADNRYKDETGDSRHVDKLFLDAGDGNLRSTIYKFCKQSKHARCLMPSLGIGIGAKKTPFSQYRKNKGERYGQNWRMPNPQKGQPRHVAIDALPLSRIDPSVLR